MKNPREKAVSKLSVDTVLEMESLNETELKQVIFEASNAMKQVRDELEANEKYQELLNSKKDMESAKREVDARQKARIDFALSLMESFGQAVV
jgi:hypothetical protein